MITSIFITVFPTYFEVFKFEILVLGLVLKFASMKPIYTSQHARYKKTLPSTRYNYDFS